MKNKLLLSTLFMTGFLSVNAQVGINTETPETTLDVRGDNHGVSGPGAVGAKDGVLVPRVTLLGTDGEQDGQLVYLVADDGTNGFTKGFHYWNATADAWLPLGKADADIIALAQANADVRMIGTNNHITMDAGTSGDGTTISGSDNIALGNQAGMNTQIAARNIIQGKDAGSRASASGAQNIGNDNIIQGTSTGEESTISNSNTIMGFEAAKYSNVGNFNQIMGYFALRGTAASPTSILNGNIAMGVNVGQDAVSIASNNIILGTSAGNSAQMGINNSMFGLFASFGSTFNRSNSVIGDNAGRNATGGSYNILLGEQVARAQTFGDNNIAIGRVRLANTGTGPEASNQLNIQNIIYGTGNTFINSSNPDPNGKLGIGEPAPAERLDVAGIVKANSFRMNFQSGGTITPTTGFITTTSNISIPGLNTGNYPAGRLLYIKNTGAGSINVLPTSPSTIDGVSTRPLASNQTLILISTGTNWLEVSEM